VGQDLRNDGDIFDGSEDRQGAAALGAGFHIDLERFFTKVLPGCRPEGWRSPFKTTRF
jgi:hypothetical protein